MNVVNMNTDNSAEWPDNFSEFKELETILSCGICFEYMSTCMMTRCSHNFCSVCIRRYLGYKQQCPICLDKALEFELRNNRMVDDIIQMFKQTRTKLLTALKTGSCAEQESSRAGMGDFTTNANALPSGHSRSPAILTMGKSLSSPDIKISSLQNRLTDKNTEKKDRYFSKSLKSETDSDCSLRSKTSVLHDADITTQESDCDSDATVNCTPPSEIPSSAGVSSVNKQTKGEARTVDCDFVVGDNNRPKVSASLSLNASSGFASPVSSRSNTSSSVSSAMALPSPSTVTVTCPVCRSDVPSRNINLHLDRCLNEDGRRNEAQSSQPPKRKPLPKLVYTLLSEKELRKKLGEVGLPTNGNRQAMIKRHHDFTLIYNAQCDSLNPKSVQQIVSEVIEAEAVKLRSAVPSTSTMKVKIDKSYTAEQVEVAQKSYVSHHKAQFNELVMAAKNSWQRKTDNKKPVTETLASVDAVLIDDTGSSSSTHSQEADVFKQPLTAVGKMSCTEGTDFRDNVTGLETIVETSTDRGSNSSDSFSLFPESEISSVFHSSTESSSAALGDNLENDSVTDATSSNNTSSRPSRRSRRKLYNTGPHQQVETDPAPMLETQLKDSSSEMVPGSPSVTRHILRSATNKKRLRDQEMATDSDAVDVEERDNEIDDDFDDDYEVSMSYSGKKQKVISRSSARRRTKTKTSNTETQ